LDATLDGRYVYVVDKGDGINNGSVSVIRTSNNEVMEQITVGVNPWDVKVSSDGQFVYVSNRGDSGMNRPGGLTVIGFGP
jgi:YVTN family beta-propeller protein